MRRSHAFAEMLVTHLDRIEPSRLASEVDSLALNIGGLICDAEIGLSAAKEDKIIAALRRGMVEILREYQPERHAML